MGTRLARDAFGVLVADLTANRTALRVNALGGLRELARHQPAYAAVVATVLSYVPGADDAA